MKVEVERLPKKTVKLKITLAAEKIKSTREHVIEEMAKNVEIPGFRKGAAPKNLVEGQLDSAKIRGEVINHLIPPAYDQAVKENLIKPIVLPKIEVLSFEDNQDLTFSATTCEAPEIKLGNYPELLSKVKDLPSTTDQKSKIILGPDGQPIAPPEEKDSTDPQQEKIDKVLETLLKTAEIEVSDLLIEDEVSRMLSRLIDQTGRLGLTVEQYLLSAGKNIDQLKEEYRQSAEKTLKLEFILMKIAKEEGIKIEESEISDIINGAPDEPSRHNLSQPENRAYLEGVLLKNKVIQKLLELTK